MKPTILIVDDEKEIRDLFQDVLTQEGYKVFTATNGSEAVSLGKQNRLDLALLDLKMPGMDGIETLHELRKFKKDLEVIVMTGYGTLNAAKEAMKLGAYEFLTKPFDLRLVKNIIQQALERKKEG